MTHTADVVVVGAGVVGAAAAWALAAEGARVRVLEAGIPGGGTTAAAMGHVVVMDDSPAQLALTAYSRGLFAELADELPAACELDPCGTLWVAEGADGLGGVREKAARLRGAGVGVEVLDDAALREAEPGLAAGLAGALRVPGDLVVYPPALADWLLERAREGGARLHRGVRVLGLEEGAALAQEGRFEGEIVVNATGRGAAGLDPALPVSPRRGHLAITDRYPGRCRHQVVELGYLESAHEDEGESVAFNVQPRRTGQILIGSSREPGVGAAGVRWDLLGRMLERARRFMPGLAGMSVIRTWSGVRPATPDGLPLIGPVPGAPGRWVAAGHEGLGVTTALGTARILADRLLGRAPALDPAPYDPAREIAA